MAKVRTYPTVEHIMQTTAFKTVKLAAGALEALKWLDDGAPEKFDGLKGHYTFAMEHFITPIKDSGRAFDFEDDKCGTACCIAGAIWCFTKDQNGDKKVRHFPDMEEYFGLADGTSDANDLHALFYAEDAWKDLEQITAKEAAKCLRHYLKKGVVDWGRALD